MKAQTLASETIGMVRIDPNTFRLIMAISNGVVAIMLIGTTGPTPITITGILSTISRCIDVAYANCVCFLHRYADVLWRNGRPFAYCLITVDGLGPCEVLIKVAIRRAFILSYSGTIDVPESNTRHATL
jgi:hypothetical protein